MGLDSVELVLSIEEEFGLDIPDRDAEKMLTVGDVYEWLKIRIAGSDPSVCLTQKVFYKLRRALVENYRLDRQAIAPDTRLSDLLTLNLIEDGWPFLQMFIDLKTPPMAVADEFLGFRLSDKTLTVRELVESLILFNRSSLTPQHESEEEIWHKLVRVFVRQLNVDIDEVYPAAIITRDLGVD